MSAIECTCDDPSFGHLGRPNCILTQKALAFPMFSPRNRANGTRNYLPASTTAITAWLTAYGISYTNINTVLGLSLANNAAVTLKHCVDYRLSPLVGALDRLYPSLRVENAQFPRTDTVYESAPSGRKIKVEGVGGVRTWSFELWGKDGCYGVARAFKKFGCSDIDAYYVDVAGNLWGIMDDATGGIVRGYEVDTETFESIVNFATDTTVQKLMVSFDIDNYECEENAWAITAEEYGSKFSAIKPLIQGYGTLDEGSSTLATGAPAVIVVSLYALFGSAGNKHDIVGLGTSAFSLVDSGGTTDVAAGAWGSVVESPDGTYTLTTAGNLTADTYSLKSVATGYIVPDISVTIS